MSQRPYFILYLVFVFWVGLGSLVRCLGFHCGSFSLLSVVLKEGMAFELCIERNNSKREIRDSPAKRKRCEGYGSPPPLCSSAEEEEEKEKEKEDPRSKVVFYNYDDSDVEDDSDGMHEFTDRDYYEYNRQITESDVSLCLWLFSFFIYLNFLLNHILNYY